MVWARLEGDPVEAEAVAEASEHSHEKHRPGFAHAAEVVEVADIQALLIVLISSRPLLSWRLAATVGLGERYSQGPVAFFFSPTGAGS